MKSLDLDLLRTFVAISETGNFSTAAETVFRTPAAVSMQVKKMEETLGRTLFLRDSRTVTLTDDGQRVLAHARRMLAMDQSFYSEFFPQSLRGEVRLGLNDDIAERYLPEMLRRFSRTHPGVVVNAVVKDSAPLLDLIKERRLDIALFSRLEAQTNDRPGQILMSERIVWACCRSGISHEKDPIPVTVWDKSCAWRKAGLEALDAHGFRYRIALESGHLSAQKSAVRADLAIAPIPLSALDECIVEVGNEANLPELPSYQVALACLADLSEPAAAAADHFRACFAKRSLAA